MTCHFLFIPRMQRATVYIAGINKLDLLTALWDAQDMDSIPCSRLSYDGFFNMDAAKRALRKKNCTIVVLCGRMIMADLSGDWASPDEYDKYAGQGVFARVVSEQHAKQAERDRKPRCPVASAFGYGVFEPIDDEPLVYGKPETLQCTYCNLLLRDHLPPIKK